jgi:hypothetical protein
MANYGNYRSRRLYAFNAINELEKIVDDLGVEADRSVLPIPDHQMPSPPSDAVKREIKNQLRATLRLILAHNDGYLSHREMDIV